MYHSDDILDDSDVEMNEGIHDSDNTLTPEKSCFNKSMGELNEDWTPLKYQVGSDFESCDKKTQKNPKELLKAIKAIDTGLQRSIK